MHRAMHHCTYSEIRQNFSSSVCMLQKFLYDSSNILIVAGVPYKVWKAVLIGNIEYHNVKCTDHPSTLRKVTCSSVQYSLYIQSIKIVISLICMPVSCMFHWFSFLDHCLVAVYKFFTIWHFSFHVPRLDFSGFDILYQQYGTI